jgi:hypothetical protein
MSKGAFGKAYHLCKDKKRTAVKIIATVRAQIESSMRAQRRPTCPSRTRLRLQLNLSLPVVKSIYMCSFCQFFEELKTTVQDHKSGHFITL